jgi:hypothetical protein
LALCPIKEPLRIPFKAASIVACHEKAKEIILAYQRDPRDFKVVCERQ